MVSGPPAASAAAAVARPRAAASNSARRGPARPSAPASSRAVSLWAVRLMPRSRSLTDRGDRPAASASSSWVSLASARSCRNSPANGSPASPTAQHPLPALRPPATLHRAEPILHQQYAAPPAAAISIRLGQPGMGRPPAAA